MVDSTSDSPGGGDGGLSRRDLLVGASTVVLAGGLAACGGSGSSSSAASGGTTPAGTPKPGGTFRLGVTGGGAKDFIDGQSITTKPDQARLTSGWETLLTYDGNYKLGTDGLAEEVTQDNARAVDDPAQERHRVQQRQDAQRRRRHLLAARIADSKNKPLRRRRTRVDRPRRPQEDGQADGAHAAEDGRLDDRRAARPVLQRHRPRRLRRAPTS